MKIHDDHRRLENLAGRLRLRGWRLAHCHGCFDLLHPGHVLHLQAARRMADALLVTVTPDAHVAKGSGRPLFGQEWRVLMLAALACVDFVAVAPGPTAVEMIRLVRPTVFVKGPECRTLSTPGLDAERQAVAEAGGVVAYTEGDVFSSTELIRKLGG